MSSLDDRIAEALDEAHRSGELTRSPSWGRPLRFDDGFDETPTALRMPYKVMKDAGLVPREILMFRQLADLRRELQACADEAASSELTRAIGDLQQLIALRLEALRVHSH